MAGPAALTVVAALNKKIPLITWIEKIVLNISAYSEALWGWLSGYVPFLARLDHHLLTLLALLSGVLLRELLRPASWRLLMGRGEDAGDGSWRELAWVLLNYAALVAGFAVFGWFEHGILGILGALAVAQICVLLLYLLRWRWPRALTDWSGERIEGGELGDIVLNPFVLAFGLGGTLFFTLSGLVSTPALDVVLILAVNGIAFAIIIPILVTGSRAPAYVLLMVLGILASDWLARVVVPWVEDVMGSVPV